MFLFALKLRFSVIPVFGVKMGVVFWEEFGHLRFWAKIKGGHFKNVKKLKKKLQNDKEKGKKRKKRRKIEKKDAKRRTNCDVFSKSGKNAAPRKGFLRTSAAVAVRRQGATSEGE